MWFRYSWAGAEASRKAAFRDRSITLEPNSPTILIGRNGTGKTLAQHILATFTSLLRAKGNLRDSLLADLSALGLERVEMQFELELIRHHPPGIGYGQDGHGNLKQGRYPVDLLWDYREREHSTGFWDGSAFSFPMDTREGCWEIHEGEVRADANAKLVISDLQNEPHAHLDVVVSSKNEFTIIPDVAGIRRFWGIGHQPNIMSDADAMLQPQEVLALGDAKSFELKRALSDFSDEHPIAWLFECEDFVDALRSAARDSLVTAQAKSDSAFKHLIESWIGPEPTDVDYHPFSEDKEPYESEHAMPWDYYWAFWNWSEPWTFHGSIGDERDPFEAWALDDEFPGHVMISTRDWLVWSMQRILPIVVPMDVTREVPQVNRFILDTLELMVNTHGELIEHRFTAQVQHALQAQFTSSHFTYFELLRKVLEGEDGVQSSDFDPSSWMGDAYPGIHTDSPEEVRRMDFRDSVRNVEAWFESGILFRPIETETQGARQIISELNASLPEFTELSEISLCDTIVEVIDAVLKCRSYVDPHLRMHHELMTQHLPSQELGRMESRRNYFQCFIAIWMLKEYAKRIPDQRLNMLFMVYLRLFHRFSRKGSAHEDGFSDDQGGFRNDDWFDFLLILEQPDTMPSGYRNLLALADGVITKDDQARIFFVDEPEISLHVDWQQEIVGLLQEIVQTTNPHSMLVIATHSPEVIMNHMDHIIDFSNRLEA